MAVGVPAVSAHAITLKRDSEVKFGRRCGQVLEDREPSRSVAVAHAQVEGRIVAPWIGGGTPLASVLNGDTGRIDVVLSRGVATFPVVVVVRVGAGEIADGTRLGVEGDGLAFRARVVGTADGHVLRELVLNQHRHFRGASHTQSTRQGWVSQAKLAVHALDATDGLASGTLLRRPLRLLVARRAGVRAVRPFAAAAAAVASAFSYGEDVSKPTNGGAWVLNARPATKAEPVNRNCAVVGWEG